MPNDQDTASGPTSTDPATPVAAAPATPTALLADAPGAGTATDAPAAAPAAAAPVDGAKPVEGEGTDGKAAPEADKPPGAPEQYVDFTAPEGITLDAEVSGEFKELAKGMNLPQDKAQQVVDLGAKLVQKIETQRAQQTATALAQLAEESRNDPEFGGVLLDESLAGAKSVLEKFGTTELKEMLNTSGLGNHKEVIRLLHRVSKAISEDTIVGGKPGATPAASVAQRMYPGMNP